MLKHFNFAAVFPSYSQNMDLEYFRKFNFPGRGISLNFSYIEFA
jgi:hypothetical protein